MSDLRLQMTKEQALFLCDRRLIAPATTARELYDKHKNPDDGLLYVTYSLENVFG